MSSSRRNAYAPTMCRRNQLVARCDALVARPGRAFLLALARKDPDLECHFIRDIGWVLYRRTHKSAAPGEDMLLKELELRGPGGEMRSPGLWLIEVLQKLDKTLGGKLDPGQANREYLRHLQDEEDARERRLQSKRVDAMRDTINAMETYAIGNRKHYLMTP